KGTAVEPQPDTLGHVSGGVPGVEGPAGVATGQPEIARSIWGGAAEGHLVGARARELNGRSQLERAARDVGGRHQLGAVVAVLDAGALAIGGTDCLVAGPVPSGQFEPRSHRPEGGMDAAAFAPEVGLDPEAGVAGRARVLQLERRAPGVGPGAEAVPMHVHPDARNEPETGVVAKVDDRGGVAAAG